MSKFLMSIVVVAGIALASTPALAKHEHASNSGGEAAEHMGAEGAANTNGTAAADRDKGQARAEDRSNGQMQGGDEHKHGKGHHAKKE